MKPGSRFSGVCAAALTLGALACATAACSGSRGAEGAPPEPVLSGSPQAQAELRTLVQRFANASRPERLALERDLVAFRRRHLGDDLVRVADVHLAWIALERGDLRRAATLAALVEAGGRGTTGDIAQVLRGAALRRGGKPKPALEALRPLVGKIIDPYVRALLDEEIVSAAVDAGVWPEAVELMGVWLRDAADDERPAARRQIAALLPKVPPADLARLLRARQTAASGDVPAPELDLRRLMAARLATVARETRDVRLAQELLATSGPLLGDQGDAVAQLAAGAGTARVEAPTVGLLLSLRSPVARRRGTEIAAGVAHGLGLPGSAARLVSRDDGGEVDRIDDALGSLMAEGAAVVIAGTDREQASAAAAFARAQSVPVLLLHPPDAAAVGGPFVFVVGEEPARPSDTLTAALADRGARPVALVAPAEIVASATRGPHVALTLSCDVPIDLRAFRAAGVQGLVLDGDSFCADRTVAALEGLPLRTAFGFEALPSAGAGALVATAGRFPFVAHATESLPPEPASGPTLRAWLAAHPAPPGWWAALGRDAALLAWAGVRGLPGKVTEDPAQVKARRAAAAAAVAAATAELWTTEAKGFQGARVLPRQIGHRALAATTP